MNRLRPLGNDSEHDDARVDLAPLIDVVFLLLIFYVVAATFTQPTAVPIQRPTAGQASALPERPLVLTLSAGGQAWLGNRPWRIDDAGLLRQELAQRPGQRVVLQADGAVPTHLLVRVIDACRAAGAASVDLAADRSGS